MALAEPRRPRGPPELAPQQSPRRLAGQRPGHGVDTPSDAQATPGSASGRRGRTERAVNQPISQSIHPSPDQSCPTPCPGGPAGAARAGRLLWACPSPPRASVSPRGKGGAGRDDHSGRGCRATGHCRRGQARGGRSTVPRAPRPGRATAAARKLQTSGNSAARPDPEGVSATPARKCALTRKESHPHRQGSMP